MAENMNTIPAARIDNLVSNDVSGDVIVYDLVSHQLHHLNETSAIVWRLCNGQRTLADVSRETGMTEQTVLVALGKLAGADLLDGNLRTDVSLTGSSRRAFLKRAAVAGTAVPAIASITAPSAFANHSQGDCLAHRTHVVDANTAYHPLCAHCCRPGGGDGFCYFQPIEPFGGWFCWGQ
jgi:hypothetical protein